MARWLTITGVKPYDGRYELVFPYDFKQREWGWAKRMAGYLPGTVDEGLDGIDPELVAVMAIVALARAEKIEARDTFEVFERFQETTIGAIQLGSDEEEVDAADPPPPSSNVNGGSSGRDSPTSSETLVAPLKHSGMPASATSTSAPLTSET